MPKLPIDSIHVRDWDVPKLPINSIHMRNRDMPYDAQITLSFFSFFFRGKKLTIEEYIKILSILEAKTNLAAM
jgi:hypothetical protein